MKKPYLIIFIILILGWFVIFNSGDEGDTTSYNEQPVSETELATSDDEPDTISTDDAIVADHVIEVRGVNFAFDVEEIRVKEGNVVTINFASDEGFHDWVVDAFDAATDQVRPETPTSVTFTATTAGTYEYYCSVGSHRALGMVGTLIVE